MIKRTMSMIWIAVWCIAVLFAGEVLGNPIPGKNEGLTVTIIHTNDMHARFPETSRLSNPCSEVDSKAGKCYGGFARIATLVRQTRKSNVPSLFLNAGDTYQGSVWYNVYKWKIVSKFMNILAPDAISLGNHEFDDGVDGLIPFIENAKFPIVTANLDLSQQPNLKATKLLNSTVLSVNGTRVGVIGYLTPETKLISTTENVIFKDEVESIREEAKKLKSEGVDILIALGHSGFDIDKKIAKEVEDIDLVIGGHTNTFLYNGKQPDVEIPEGLYPTEIVQDSGRKVYVVQAYAYTKYLGNFTVSFDSKGEVTYIKGNPILVDSSIEQAADVLEELNQMKGATDNISLTVVGQTRVLLDGDSKVCRRQECNLGNLVTDAIIEYNVRQYAGNNGWTDAAIALSNSGNIRTSITRANDDKITMGDVISVLPFANNILKVSMTGELLLSILEWSVARLDTESTANLVGAFLQFSGLQVTYDLHQPANSRVVSARARCAGCSIPIYNDVQKSATYKVLITDFLHNGGDGYEMLKDLKAERLDMTVMDAVVEYIKKHSPVHPDVEWRINYLQRQRNSGNSYQSIRFMILLPLISWLFVR